MAVYTAYTILQYGRLYCIHHTAIWPSILHTPYCNMAVYTAYTILQYGRLYCIHHTAIWPSILHTPYCNMAVYTAYTILQYGRLYCIHHTAIWPSILHTPYCNMAVYTAYTILQYGRLYCIHHTAIYMYMYIYSCLYCTTAVIISWNIPSVSLLGVVRRAGEVVEGVEVRVAVSVGVEAGDGFFLFTPFPGLTGVFCTHTQHTHTHIMSQATGTFLQTYSVLLLQVHA